MLRNAVYATPGDANAKINSSGYHDTLKDSPQPHCSARAVLALLHACSRLQLTDVGILEDKALIQLVL